MRRLANWRMIVLPLLPFLVWGADGTPPPSRRSIAESAPPPPVPVVVELFTSEGCENCFQADEMLRGLTASQSVPGVEVIALEEHVSSWVWYGWRDPFSSPQFTNRQRDYSRKFQRDDIPTPQVVVGGSADLVGADTARTREEILRAAKGPRANVEVLVQSGSVAVVKAGGLPPGAGDADVMMAITENNVETVVGESAANHRTLQHAAVVRNLAVLGRLETPHAEATYSVHLRFKQLWKRQDLRLVVFIQDRVTRRIWAATTAGW